MTQQERNERATENSRRERWKGVAWAESDGNNEEEGARVMEGTLVCLDRVRWTVTPMLELRRGELLGLRRRKEGRDEG